jgi:hypothetical protein
MGESDAGFAGLPEQLRRLFPDGTWPEFPYRPKSGRIAIDSEAATNLFSLIPDWAGDWDDFRPWLRESSNYPTSEHPELSVKTVCTAIGKAAQRERDKRLSLGLMPIAAYGTSVASIVSVPLVTSHPMAGSTRVEEPAAIEASGLTPRMMHIMLALLVENAVSPALAIKNEAIVTLVKSVDPTAGEDFREPYRELCDRQLKDFRRGPSGGHWLTPRGAEAAVYIENRMAGMEFIAARMRRSVA